MLSRNQIKNITQLKYKKYRNTSQLFVAEGSKTIHELLQSQIKLHHLYTTQLYPEVADVLQTKISKIELKKISFLTNPNTALAIFEIPKEKKINDKKLIVALDNVRDPGNLGTIIRLCDWFGISHLVCNTQTVDCYNPKVIQATMGSITRVAVSYLNLEEYLRTSTLPVFGAFMDGENVYASSKLPKQGILVLGNEANGISDAIAQQVTQRISIPRFGDLKVTESLNVANATAILLSEFMRATIVP